MGVFPFLTLYPCPSYAFPYGLPTLPSIACFSFTFLYAFPSCTCLPSIPSLPFLLSALQSMPSFLFSSSLLCVPALCSVPFPFVASHVISPHLICSVTPAPPAVLKSHILFFSTQNIQTDVHRHAHWEGWFKSRPSQHGGVCMQISGVLVVGLGRWLGPPYGNTIQQGVEFLQPIFNLGGSRGTGVWTIGCGLPTKIKWHFAFRLL